MSSHSAGPLESLSTGRDVFVAVQSLIRESSYMSHQVSSSVAGTFLSTVASTSGLMLKIDSMFSSRKAASLWSTIIQERLYLALSLLPLTIVGKKLTLKADNKKVIIYHKQKVVATHLRSWGKRQRIELPAHTEQVRKMKKRLWQDSQVAAFLSLGQDAHDYLNELVKAGQPVKKNVARLLDLRDEYGTPSLILAIQKAIKYHAAGADYIENILYQEMTPQRFHQPVRLKNQNLNHIRLTQPLLAEYDAYIKRRNNK